MRTTKLFSFPSSSPETLNKLGANFFSLDRKNGSSTGNAQRTRALEESNGVQALVVKFVVITKRQPARAAKRMDENGQDFDSALSSNRLIDRGGERKEKERGKERKRNDKTAVYLRRLLTAI